MALDFSPLFRRLRELGKSVVGVGPRSILSEAVKKSCNRFIYIGEEHKPNDESSIFESTQLREDALDLLERALGKFQDGVNLSVLKNEMLEIDSAFDEKTLGFSGFKKFLQSAPETVHLYQAKKIWHAKAIEPNDPKSGSSFFDDRIKEVTLIKPTTDLYKRFLRKSGWRVRDSLFLWDALSKLKEYFPGGFTRNQEFEYLIEVFGARRTRGELRSAMYVAYKSGFVISQLTVQADEPLLTVDLPESERKMSKKIDFMTVQKLIQACKLNDMPFVAEVVPPLLNNTYSKKQLIQLFDSDQGTKAIDSVTQ